MHSGLGSFNGIVEISPESCRFGYTQLRFGIPNLRGIRELPYEAANNRKHSGVRHSDGIRSTVKTLGSDADCRREARQGDADWSDQHPDGCGRPASVPPPESPLA